MFAVSLNTLETQWVSWGCYYSNITYYAFVPVAFLTPYIFGWYLKRRYYELHYPKMKKKIGTAYDDIELISNEGASFKPGLFLFHRQLIALTLVYLPGNPVFKSWCFILSVEAYTIFILEVKPYEEY